jgi:hypothetical protein
LYPSWSFLKGDASSPIQYYVLGDWAASYSAPISGKGAENITVFITLPLSEYYPHTSSTTARRAMYFPAHAVASVSLYSSTVSEKNPFSPPYSMYILMDIFVKVYILEN